MNCTLTCPMVAGRSPVWYKLLRERYRFGGFWLGDHHRLDVSAIKPRGCPAMNELTYRLGPPSPIDHRKTWSIAITTKITISQSINQIPVLSTNLTLLYLYIPPYPPVFPTLQCFTSPVFLVDSSVCHVTRLRNVRAAFEPRHLWPRTAQAPLIAVPAPARSEKNLASLRPEFGDTHRI